MHNWRTNNLTFPKWVKGDRGAVDEDVKKRHTGVKERTSRLCPVPHKENFLTFLIKMRISELKSSEINLQLATSH